MKVDDLKKGSVVIMAGSNWRAKLLDSKRGTIRFADVYGICHEMGSVYAHNIKAYIPASEVPQGVAIPDIPDHLFKYDVELSKSQIKCRDMNTAIFG